LSSQGKSLKIALSLVTLIVLLEGLYPSSIFKATMFAIIHKELAPKVDVVNVLWGLRLKKERFWKLGMMVNVPFPTKFNALTWMI